MEEIWKDYIVNYQASNLGRIKSLPREVKFGIGYRTTKEKILKFGLGSNGYYFVNLSVNGKIMIKYVHRIITETFIPNPDNLPQVNHKNGDKFDNRVSNLEWCTSQQNISHSLSTGLAKQNGEDSHFAKLTEKQVKEIRNKYIPRKYTLAMLAKEYNVSHATILKIIKNKSWKHLLH